MAQHNVTITVQADGTLDFKKKEDGTSARRLRAKRLESITWECEKPFGVFFEQATPFDERILHSGAPPPTITKQVLAGAALGSYWYSASVNRGGDQPPAIDDPEIIIDPD